MQKLLKKKQRQLKKRKQLSKKQQKLQKKLKKQRQKRKKSLTGTALRQTQILTQQNKELTWRRYTTAH